MHIQNRHGAENPGGWKLGVEYPLAADNVSGPLPGSVANFAQEVMKESREMLRVTSKLR